MKKLKDGNIMKELKSNLMSVSDIFQHNQENRFDIPPFQRRFVWTRENVSDMFDDFAEDSNDYSFKSLLELPGYLLGNIVLIDNSNNFPEYIVVDGQQRLTTLSLIYKAIYNRFSSMADSTNNKDKKRFFDVKSDKAANNYYIRDDNWVVIRPRLQHDSMLSYSKAYASILSNDDNFDFSKEESSENIFEVWEEINEQINAMNDKQFSNFVKYLDDNVKIIKTVFPSDDKTFQLFEVLNDRGQSLDPLDLIKNILLREVSLSKSLKLDAFNEYWTHFSENMYISKTIGSKPKNHSSIFLKYFIMSEYGEKIAKSKLVSFFRNRIKNDNLQSSDIINLVRKLAKYSKVYKNMIKNPKSNEFSSSDSMYILYMLKIQQFHQIFMMFYFNEDVSFDELNDIREKVLASCVRMGLSTFYNYDLANKIDAEMPSIVNTYRNSIEKGNSINESVNKMIKIMDSYNEKQYPLIESSLPTRSMGNTKALNLLKIIEILINKNTGITKKQPKGQGITLEHILPQNEPTNVNELGFNKDDDYNQIINTIGNLTLLKKRDNSALQDKNFDQKKEYYKKSNLLITEAISGTFTSIPKSGSEKERIDKITQNYEKSYYANNQWTKEDIYQRGKELTKLLIDFTVNKI